MRIIITHAAPKGQVPRPFLVRHVPFSHTPDLINTKTTPEIHIFY